MRINDVIFQQDAFDIVTELQRQLELNHIPLLQVVKDTPDNVMVACPYHKNGQEKRPSAGIKKSDGTFHCFACGEVHDLQEVISNCFGKNDFGAFGWEWLLKNFYSVSIENRKDIPLDLRRGDEKSSDKQYVSEEELESYRVYHDYMYKRKLTDEIIDLFDIGYDSKTQCITFPIRDINGNTLFVARRSVNTKYFNYPNRAEKPLYGLYELSKLEKLPTDIIVCESMLDALVCWVYGKPALALNGLGSAKQIEDLKRTPFREIILALDNDIAGQTAIRVLKDKLKKDKVVSQYVLPSNRKDMNELSKDEFESLKKIYIL